MQKPTSTDTASPPAADRPSVKERFKRLMKDYGPVALLVYLSTFLVSMTVFTIVIQVGFDLKALGERFGVQLDGTSGLMGTLGAAWVLSKVIQVPRIFATLALTPIVGRIPVVTRLLRRLQEQQEEAPKA
ncbi:MAG TPA: DUF1279 domain-containing protein [Hyalangium sp.]|nr:DUF1279 domain-containing protein [Hyalangium sp.]